MRKLDLVCLLQNLGCWRCLHSLGCLDLTGWCLLLHRLCWRNLRLQDCHGLCWVCGIRLGVQDLPRAVRHWQSLRVLREKNGGGFRVL